MKRVIKFSTPFGEASALLIVGSRARCKPIEALAPGLIVGASEGNQTLYSLIPSISTIFHLYIFIDRVLMASVQIIPCPF